MAYRDFLTYSENTINEDPSTFFNFIKNKTQHRPSDYFKNNGTILNNPADITEAFANYFESVNDVTHSNYKIDEIDPGESISQMLNKTDLFNFTKVSLKEVELGIRKLKSKRTMGPDGIPQYLVKGCSDVLKEPLQIIFNLSLMTHTFPEQWKEALVVPIPKSANDRDIQNFRPIAKLSTFCKVFESIMYHRILTHIKPDISISQHGFLPHRSTVTNLATLTEHITSEINNGSQVDVVYTDFKKAFDTVNHDLLLHKLRMFNFSNSALQLLSSYLYNRKLAVSYKQNFSRNYKMQSGVPQGSNLGPLLFLIFINDLPGRVKCSTLLYADDLKIYKTINSPEDNIALQEDINNIQDWCISNNLHLNISKCKTMSFTNRKNTLSFPYSINNNLIEKPDIVKDLGVKFDPALSFSEHIETIVREAYRNLGFICRIGKELKNISTLQKLYVTYVRAKLEYCSTIWCPYTKKNIENIEKIQNKFLRYIVYKGTGLYPRNDSGAQLILNTGISTLESRRKLLDLLFLYKLLHSAIDSTDLVSRISLQVPSLSTRPGNSGLFHLNRPRKNILNLSPIWRMCYLYNSILKCTSEVNIDIYSMSRTNFKRTINNILSHENLC